MLERNDVSLFVPTKDFNSVHSGNKISICIIPNLVSVGSECNLPNQTFEKMSSHLEKKTISLNIHPCSYQLNHR